MEFNSYSDLLQLEYISHGSYGDIYKCDSDTAIKVYKEPSLLKEGLQKQYYMTAGRMKLIQKKQENIHMTSLPRERLFIGGKCSGVVLTYINGEKIEKIISSLSHSDKKDIGIEIINKVEELTDNTIYPLDCKLRNIMLDVNGNTHLIDLDDDFTKILRHKNFFYYHSNMTGLKYTLVDLFDNDHISSIKSDNSLDNKFIWNLRSGYDDCRQYVKKR